MASHCGFQGILFLPPPLLGLQLSSVPGYWKMQGFSHLFLLPIGIAGYLPRQCLLDPL